MSGIRREEGRRLFGSDPATYDRGRPGHPPRVYELLVERCGLEPGVRVLEIGPGTGQATRRLLDLGAHVVAVEPDPALAAYLTATARGSLAVRNEPLEDAELPEEAFDLAAAASCFHWIDEDAGLSKIFASLRPGGSVALWWTLFGAGDGRDPFQREVSAALDVDGIALERSPSAGREGGPRFALDVDARLPALTRAGFVGAEHEVITWTHTWDTAGIRALYATFSPVIRLTSAKRAAVLDAVTEASERFGGRVERPLRTSLYSAQRPRAVA
jgi:SAM-dependent methyltransferase